MACFLSIWFFFCSLEKIDFIFQISFSLFWTFCNVSALQMTTEPNERRMVQSITNKDSHLFWLTQTIFGLVIFFLLNIFSIINRYMYEHSEAARKKSIKLIFLPFIIKLMVLLLVVAFSNANTIRIRRIPDIKDAHPYNHEDVGYQQCVESHGCVSPKFIALFFC